MITKHLDVSGINKDQNTNGGINTTTNAGGTAASESHITPKEAIEALQVETNQTIVKENHQFVRIRDQIVSRLELEATRNVMLNVELSLLYASTWVTFIAFTMICQSSTINDDMNEEQKYKAIVEQCSSYHWAISYITRFVSLISQ